MRRGLLDECVEVWSEDSGRLATHDHCRKHPVAKARGTFADGSFDVAASISWIGVGPLKRGRVLFRAALLGQAVSAIEVVLDPFGPYRVTGIDFSARETHLGAEEASFKVEN